MGLDAVDVHGDLAVLEGPSILLRSRTSSMRAEVRGEPA
jgi:hypothetical protein